MFSWWSWECPCNESFSKKSVTFFLEEAGFTDILFYEINEDMKKYGIFWSPEDGNNHNNHNNSLIISAKKT